jgi:hypothetical protein
MTNEVAATAKAAMPAITFRRYWFLDLITLSAAVASF